MFIAILQFELLFKGAESLKDKRRVVQSLKDRLHREHQCSVAEVGLTQSFRAARLGLAVVGSDGGHLGKVLDAITLKIRGFSHEAELGDVLREIVSNGSLPNVEGVDATGGAASTGHVGTEGWETWTAATDPALDEDLMAELERRGEEGAGEIEGGIR